MESWHLEDEAFITWMEGMRNRILLTQGYNVSEPENERAPNELFLGTASTYAKQIWHLITLYSKDYYFLALHSAQHEKTSLAQAQVMTLRYALKVHAICTYGAPLTADIDMRKGWKIVQCLPEESSVSTRSRTIISSPRPTTSAWVISESSETAKIKH